MAWPITHAPIRNMQIQFDHVLKAASTERTPHRTSMARDESDVAGMGIGSETHNVTVHRKIPRVRIPTGVTFCRGGSHTASRKKRGPSQRPVNRLRFSNRTSMSDSLGAISARPCQLICRKIRGQTPNFLYFRNSVSVPEFSPI